MKLRDFLIHDSEFTGMYLEPSALQKCIAIKGISLGDLRSLNSTFQIQFRNCWLLKMSVNFWVSGLKYFDDVAISDHSSELDRLYATGIGTGLKLQEYSFTFNEGSSIPIIAESDELMLT